MEKIDIKSKLPDEITGILESMGEKAFRGEQVFRWLHGGVRSFDEMTNLPARLRERLGCEFYITAPGIAAKQVSGIDGTVKYLWRLADGVMIESVVMEYEHGTSVCISTQAGCRMGCAFCASTIGGLVRDLSASEMIDQVLFSQIDIGRRISSIVLMGIGEPLDNFDNVMRFAVLANNPIGLNIGARHIVLSTCGITKYIDKLAGCGIQLSLAVSLHAPDDDTRRLLMPVAHEITVSGLLAACSRYSDKTGRRVTYEYALIDGVNDTAKHAGELSRKLKNSGAHLNIITLSDVPGRRFKPSSRKAADAFARELKRNGINYTVRRKLGADIEASCGQLRNRGVQTEN